MMTMKPLTSADHTLHCIARIQLDGARRQLFDAQRAGGHTRAIAARIARLDAQVAAYDARVAEEPDALGAGIF